MLEFCVSGYEFIEVGVGIGAAGYEFVEVVEYRVSFGIGVAGYEFVVVIEYRVSFGIGLCLGFAGYQLVIKVDFGGGVAGADGGVTATGMEVVLGGGEGGKEKGEGEEG